MADQKQPNRAFVVILGGLVGLAAAIFSVTGGDLGGTKKVAGDHDLPQITSPKTSPDSDLNTGRR